MKIQSAVAAALLLAACSQPANNAEATPAPEATPSPASATAGASPTETMPSDAPTAGPVASASGTVEAIDAASGKITLAHGPVPALNWPSMTMAFKATPEQMASVEVGQKVEFDFVAKGMDATITRIEAK